MRKRALVPLIVVLLGLCFAFPAAARRAKEDQHSKNIRQLAQVPIEGNQGPVSGSDLAFQGDLLVAGSYEGLGLFRILDRAPFVKQLSFYDCPGAQGDVAVLGDYVFISIDSASSNNGDSNVCNNTQGSTGKEGVRIVDISNPTQPRQVAFVETDCGSHTHVLVPGKKTSYIYVQSYPLGAPTPECNVGSHRKISVIGFPTKDPSKAKIVSTPDVSPEIGCHDIGVYQERDLAVAACIGETQVWDIKDPAHPKIIARIVNPAIEIHHSAALTWDGKYALIGDEFAGSVTGQCLGEQQSPVGAFWIYDMADPTSPQLVGHYNVPRRGDPESADEVSYIACTTHNFNVLPMKDPDRYIAAIGYRASGISIVDFSDPAAPEEMAFYLQMNGGTIPDVWGAYWYNGRIYANDNGALRGVSVYELEGTGAKEVHYFRDRLNPQTQITDFL